MNFMLDSGAQPSYNSACLLHCPPSRFKTLAPLKARRKGFQSRTCETDSHFVEHKLLYIPLLGKDLHSKQSTTISFAPNQPASLTLESTALHVILALTVPEKKSDDSINQKYPKTVNSEL